MSSMTTLTAVNITQNQPIAASELARACGADINWVVQLVEVGIVRGDRVGEQAIQWHFYSDDLQCALEARRLERDFGVELEAAALILDLQHEVRRLKAALQVHAR